MSVRFVPLAQLESDARRLLTECVDSGHTLVVELPDHRLVSIQVLELDSEDDLVDRLLESNPAFRAVVERSKQSARRPFPSS